MKKMITAALAALLLMSAASCGVEAPAADVSTEASAPVPVKEFTAKDVTDAVMIEIPIASEVEKSRESLEDYFYDLNIDDVEDFSYVLCASGMSPDEIAFFKLKSEDAAAKAKEAVEKRLKEHGDTFRDYVPAESYKIDDAVLKQSGVYVYYLITTDSRRAEEIVTEFIG